MSEDATSHWPDLAKGIPTEQLGEGAMLAGHVGGDAVLVARLEGELYAMGAECTHYHGPLGKGLIKDGIVRCPWHHACFSLKTGEAVGAPAFDPLDCYKVREAEGRIVVGAKLEKPGQAVPRSPGPQKIVIVGGGAGGFAAAEMLRRKGFAGELVMLSADVDAPYDRPNCSKDFLAGKAPANWMPLRPDGYYNDHGIELRLGTWVESLDAATKTVKLKGGEIVAYDALVLATGAEPQRPPIPGFDGKNVFVLRTLRDAEALAAAAQDAKVAVVVGASFIGLEVAAALRTRGLTVHVVAPEGIPFEKILGADIGRWAQRVHEERGVVFHLRRKVEAFSNGVVQLEGGSAIEASIVVVGTGVKPRVELAQRAGLKVDDGVVVDDRLRASKDIYAVGDIARYPEPISGKLARIEHWVHAERQGQHVARVILGEDRPYREPPFFWSAHDEAAIHYVGHAEAFDAPHVAGSTEAYDASVFYEKDGALLAVATLDRDMASLEAEAAFEKVIALKP